MNSGASGTVYNSISILIPCYNEEGSLHEMHRKLSDVLLDLPYKIDITYVNDGSTDDSLTILKELHDTDTRVSIIDLSRNFGKEIAMSAGLDHASGDAIIIIDADLQHPPELIPRMIDYWLDGYDVVYAVRKTRKDESYIKKTLAGYFYSIMNKISDVKIPKDSSDYRLLSRRAVESIRALRERHRFMKGLFTWIGYRQIAVPYQPDNRFSGKSKWNYWHLWNFAIEGITSFSTAPLRISTILGVITAGISLCYGLYIVTDTIVYGNPVPGYPSLMVVVLFLGGVQMMFIGMIGEYIGKMFNETKNRPLYFVKSYISSKADKTVEEKVGKVDDTF